ncbi:MAG: pyridoxal 5'-phosphate synthase glutaminase subunit PdxT [Acidimicrobiales bacterium]
MRIGVLALQGDFLEHMNALRALDVDAVEVRTTEEFARCDGLILPGGESTTMSMLLESSGIVPLLRQRIDEGFATFGTCAGMILLASEIADGRPDQIRLGALDIRVRRNGFGRQLRSFQADVDLSEVGDPPMRAVFIRAPAIERVGEGVEVMASVDYQFADGHQERVPVVCRSGSVLASAFHPELTGDTRLHAYFVKLVESQ